MNKNKLELVKTFDSNDSNKTDLTVVLIHGIASDSSTFDGFLDYCKDKSLGVRFVTFDLLGSGKSIKSEELNYDYEEQVAALHNSIKKLGCDKPVILVGHSLGTFIVTRFASIYPELVKKLILVSPPVYTISDLDNPAFKTAIDAFCKVVDFRKRGASKERSFVNSMNNIVLDRTNYDTLVALKAPVDFIYGDEDGIIASYNVPLLKKQCAGRLKAIKVHGKHGVTPEKYDVIINSIEEVGRA